MLPIYTIAANKCGTIGSFLPLLKLMRRKFCSHIFISEKLPLSFFHPSDFDGYTLPVYQLGLKYPLEDQRGFFLSKMKVYTVIQLQGLKFRLIDDETNECDVGLKIFDEILIDSKCKALRASFILQKKLLMHVPTRNSSVIRQKDESQNGCYKETKHVKCSEKNEYFLPPDTHT